MLFPVPYGLNVKLKVHGTTTLNNVRFHYIDGIFYYFLVSYP